MKANDAPRKMMPVVMAVRPKLAKYGDGGRTSSRRSNATEKESTVIAMTA